MFLYWKKNVLVWISKHILVCFIRCRLGSLMFTMINYGQYVLIQINTLVNTDGIICVQGHTYKSACSFIKSLDKRTLKGKTDLQDYITVCYLHVLKQRTKCLCIPLRSRASTPQMMRACQCSTCLAFIPPHPHKWGANPTLCPT